MRLHLRPAALPGRRPRRTVRLRLTALYGGLFLVSGAGLLAITIGIVMAHGWPPPSSAGTVGIPEGVSAARAIR